MVSVIMITYKHEQYIGQAIEGILMQQCDFDVELIIADDHSTDNTQEVVKNIIENHPKGNSIKYTRHETNKGMQPNFIWAYTQCKGKYIAVCEGDDYWVDPLKLQKQISFLEANPEYKVSMGRVDMLMENSGKIKRRKEEVDPTKTETYTLKDYLKNPFSQTSSFVFRKLNTPLPDWFAKVHAGDKSFVIINTGTTGKIKYHADLFSIYRVNDTSASNTTDYNVYDRSTETIQHWRSFLGKEYDTIFKWIKIRNTIYKKNNSCKSLPCKIYYYGLIKTVNLYIRFL